MQRIKQSMTARRTRKPRAVKRFTRLRQAVSCSLSILAVTVLCSCAGTRATPTFIQPSTAAIGQATAEAKAHTTKAQVSGRAAKQSIKQAEAKAPQAKLELELAGQQVDTLLTELDQTQDALSRSEGSRTQLDSELRTQTKLANQASTDLRELQPRLTAVTHKYHRAKLILGSLMTGAIALLMWKFKAMLAFIPPPYNLVVMAGAPVVAGTLIYLLL